VPLPCRHRRLDVPVLRSHVSTIRMALHYFCCFEHAESSCRSRECKLHPWRPLALGVRPRRAYQLSSFGQRVRRPAKGYPSTNADGPTPYGAPVRRDPRPTRYFDIVSPRYERFLIVQRLFIRLSRRYQSNESELLQLFPAPRDNSSCSPISRLSGF